MRTLNQVIRKKIYKRWWSTLISFQFFSLLKNILNNLENLAESKIKSTLKRKFQQLENKAKQHFFPTLNAAVKHICNDWMLLNENCTSTLTRYSFTVLSIVNCYIRTGKSFAILNLTAHGYKNFNVSEGQIKYDLLSNIIFLIGHLLHPQKTNQYRGIHRHKHKQISKFDCNLSMASLITGFFEADNPNNHYFRAKELKKLDKISLEDRALEQEYNCQRSSQKTMYHGDDGRLYNLEFNAQHTEISNMNTHCTATVHTLQ